MYEDIEKVSYLPPHTNRGVENTIKDGVFLLFDWVQATIFPNQRFNDIYDLFYYIFKVPRSEVLYNAKSAHFGYTHCYSYRNLCLFVNDLRSDMGVHIYLTGSGCRDLEELGIDYKDFFGRLISQDCQFTRVDISIDNFTNKYFSLKKINRCIVSEEVVTKFRSSIQFKKDSLKEKENLGHTIWFGSRASDVQIVFYDKLLERKAANYEVHDDIKYWTRLEMRLRNEKARDMIVNYMYWFDFNSYYLGIISNYISFKNKNTKDKNRSRWSNKKWWDEFLEYIEKIKFQSKPVEYSITKKRGWLDRTVSRTNFSVLLSDIKDLSSDNILSEYLYDLIINGGLKLTHLELQHINQYRIKKGLVPLEYEEVNDFIKDIKEVLLIK